MSAAAEILRSYLAPEATLRGRQTDAPGEARALIWLVSGLVMIYAAQLPALYRQALAAGGDPPFVALAAGAALGTLLFAPLLFYALAGLSVLVAHLFGRRMSGLGARVALFWALLAAAPLMLLRSVAETLAGPGALETVLTGLAGLAFLAFWLIGMREASRIRGHGLN